MTKPVCDNLVSLSFGELLATKMELFAKLKQNLTST